MDDNHEELKIKLAIVTNQRNAAMDEIASLAAKIHILENRLNNLSNKQAGQVQP